MTKIAILTMFKNESHIIYEWTKHNLNLGIDHIYMINNESTDNYTKPLQFIDTSKITIYYEEGEGIQLPIFRKYYKLIRKHYDWVFITDLDEFLYFNDSNMNLKTFLDDHDNKIKAISIQWTIYAHDKLYQPKSVINDNLIEYKNPKYDHKDCKSIIRTCVLPKFITKSHYPDIDINNRKIYYSSDNIVQLNHYRTQSWEFILGIKYTRGGSNIDGDKYKDKLIKFAKKQKGKQSVNTNLRDQSTQLINQIETMEQIKPQIRSDNDLFVKVKTIVESRNFNEKSKHFNREVLNIIKNKIKK